MRTWKKRFFVVQRDDAQLRFAYYKDEAHSTSSRDKPLGTFALAAREHVRLLEPPRSPLGDRPVMEVCSRRVVETSVRS